MTYLNLDQSPAELADLYGGRDYYWYLRSDPFREAFLRPLGRMVNELRLPCLDVGCGEGQLAEFVTGIYVGIDGSASAVARGKARNPRLDIRAGRLEAPDPAWGPAGTAVFGGIMEVLVRPDRRVPLVELYRETFGLSYLVVYDLERLDTGALEGRYRKLSEYHARAEMPDLEPAVKRDRKILVFEL